MSEDPPSPDGTAAPTVERTRTLAARAITAIDPSGGAVDPSQPPDGASDPYPYGGPVPGGAPPQTGPPFGAPWAPAQPGYGEALPGMSRPPESHGPPAKRGGSPARTATEAAKARHLRIGLEVSLQRLGDAPSGRDQVLLLQEVSETLTTQLSEQRRTAQEAQTEARRARWIAVTSVVVGIVGMAFGLVEVLLSL